MGAIAKGCAPITGQALAPPPSSLSALFSYVMPSAAATERPSAALTNQLAQFPPVLERLPFWCFMLRRGPLLGPILQHPDDIIAMRQAFLSCSYSAAMGAPRRSCVGRPLPAAQDVDCVQG